MELVEYVNNDKEKKTNISKSTAPQVIKLDGGLDTVLPNGSSLDDKSSRRPFGLKGRLLGVF